MLIKSDYHVFEAASKDDSRAALRYVSLQPDQGVDPDPDGWITGRAYATDGFILAVVPVQLFKDDIAGLISADVMRQAFKASKRFKLADVSIVLDQPGYAVLQDGAMLPRWDNQGDGDLSYPDVAGFVPSKRPTVADRQGRGFHLMAAGLSPSYYARVVKAIGCQSATHGRGSAHGSVFPRLVFGSVGAHGSTSDPVMVEPQDHSVSAVFVPPFGLIMPMYSGNGSGRMASGVDWDQKSNK